MSEGRADRKWLVPDPRSGSRAEQQTYWQDLYNRGDYKDVLSLTKDRSALEKILSGLGRQRSLAKVLIPGCGPYPDLPLAIRKQFGSNVELICTDYVEIRELTPAGEGVRYVCVDTVNLPWTGYFDAVVIVNSILSESDAENRDMIEACFRALAPGGSLVGFFPTIFCALDIAVLENNSDKLQNIELGSSLCYEQVQDAKQVFYTPLRLRRILKEAGFDLASMELFFCDSDYFSANSERLYDIVDDDLCPYEFFVVATKGR